MVCKEPVNNGQGDSESIIDLSFDNQSAQLAKGVRNDVHVGYIQMRYVQTQIHVCDQGSEREIEANEADLRGHFSGVVGFLNPELQIERSRAAHHLVSLRDLEVVDADRVEVYGNWQTRTIVVYDTREQDVNSVSCQRSNPSTVNPSMDSLNFDQTVEEAIN